MISREQFEEGIFMQNGQSVPAHMLILTNAAGQLSYTPAIVNEHELEGLEGTEVQPGLKVVWSIPKPLLVGMLRSVEAFEKEAMQ